MKVEEEKEYIYSLMKEITQERRQLTQIYYDLKVRLDDLNKLEEKGLDELSLKGYLDLQNARNIEAVKANLSRETGRIIESVTPKKEESVAQIEEKQKNGHKKFRRRKVSDEAIKSVVIEILKERGTPIKLSELLQPVNSALGANLTKQNFCYIIMKNIIEKSDKLNRPMKGYVQYIN